MDDALDTLSGMLLAINPTRSHLPAARSSPLNSPRTRNRVAMLTVPPQTVHALMLNSGLAAIGQAKLRRSLTPSGILHAWALGVMLWSSLGWRGWSTGMLYFILGSKVTKVKMAEKEKLGIAEGRGGRRGPENVWGSAATAAACALASAKWPGYPSILFNIGFVTAFATKLSDTFASEIGKAYGKTTYLITSLKSVPPGTEGAVSLEGTLAGVVGSIAITVYAIAIGLVGRFAFLPSLLATFFATNVESFIGAVAQGRFKLLTNEVVNFIMTVIGAFTGMGLAIAFAGR